MAKDTNIPPFGEEGLKLFQQFNPFKQFKAPGMDMGVLMSNYQRNMELISATQQVVAEATKSIMELQSEYMKKVFDQWNTQVKDRCSKSPLEEKTAHQAEAAETAVKQTIAHTQALNAIVTKSNEQIIDSVQKRFKEGLDESMNITKKGPGKK